MNADELAEWTSALSFIIPCQPTPLQPIHPLALSASQHKHVHIQKKAF